MAQQTLTCAFKKNIYENISDISPHQTLAILLLMVPKIRRENHLGCLQKPVNNGYKLPTSTGLGCHQHLTPHGISTNNGPDHMSWIDSSLVVGEGHDPPGNWIDILGLVNSLKLTNAVYIP